jgi:putative transposase
MTDMTFAEVLERQRWPLCCQYLVVLFDSLPVQIEEENAVRDKAIHLALGVLADGSHEAMGPWIDPAPGVTGWRKVLGHLKERGVEGIRFAGADAPKGLPTALRAAFPAAKQQPSIAHLIRHCLTEATTRDRLSLAEALRPIYTAANAAAAQTALDAFAAGTWGEKYPSILKRWRAALSQLTSFFALPRRVRRTILSGVHAIETFHLRLSRATGRHGPFAGDQEATVFVWLALDREAQRQRRSAQAEHLTKNARIAQVAAGE